ncbi:MAG: Do family serine endopeptidase [Pirellula sp.]
MNRPLGTWKLLFLLVIISAPIGYWLLSHQAAQPSHAYAQQITEAQQARGTLDRVNTTGAEQISKVFRDVAKSLKPSVVSIKNMVDVSSLARGQGLSIEDLLGPLGGGIGGGIGGYNDDVPQNGRIDNGLGSGVIVSPDGYILTNNHVVKGASVLEVVLSDERVFEAKVVGTDPRTDIAVLKIDATGLVAAPIGRSSAMEVGDWVIAIGSPFGLAQTVTAGIVSAINRTGQDITLYDDFIQTDAAINPGNSGGPLLNLRGEVIGINTAIASRGGGYNGVCFAVPSDTAQRILSDFITKGRVTRGVIGLEPLTLAPNIRDKLSLPKDLKGALVLSVSDDYPAAKAGLKKGDVITAINGERITTGSALRRAIGETKPGTQVRLTDVRDGRSTDVTLQVQELDEEALAASSGGTVQGYGLVIGQVSREAREEYGLAAGEGVEVKGVDRRGPFQGLIPPGVVILSVNGVQVNSPQKFSEAMKMATKSGSIKLIVRDSEGEKTVRLRVQ